MPGTALSKAGMELLSARLGDVRRQQARLRDQPARAAVHDTRVSTRRLRAALKVFGNKELRRYDREVKQFQDALGAVRDLQLQLQWLNGHDRPQAALRPIANEQKQLLRTRSRELRQRLGKWRNQTAPALLKAVTAYRAVGRLGSGKMRRHLRKRLARVMPQLAAFGDSTDPATIHRLRIALKKLRYDVELLAPAFPAYAGLALSVLAPLQGELGSVHDKDVRMELLWRFLGKGPERHGDKLAALIGDVLESRESEVEALSTKTAWLVSEKIPERLRSLLD
jgi:CHAD domain-containing protein